MSSGVELVNQIIYEIKSNPHEYQNYEDLFGLVYDAPGDNVNLLKWIASMVNRELQECDVDFAEQFDDLLKRVFTKVAPYDFDSYMIALEWNREPRDRFYLPRRNTLKPLADAIQDLADDKLDELFLSMPPRVGKALADNTPILTTEGWKKHGDLKVGDTIFRPDGKTTKVIAVHPKCRMTHTVTFTDGTSIDCHFRHEWKVYNRFTQRVELLETQNMIGRLDYGTPGKRGHRYMFLLPSIEPIEGVYTDLPVDPYVFGVWLGDGANKAPRITGDKKDYPIIEKCISRGYWVRNEYTHKTTGVMSYDLDGLRRDLNTMGFCHTRYRVPKYIPDCYLSASLNQRLELLAGLLDTDGTLIKKDHRYQFTTAEEGLKNSVISLVSTFGWRASVKEYKPVTSSSGIVGKKTCWCIGFNPTFEIPCVLERKKLTEFSKVRHISIKSITPIENEVMGNCITVEQDGMYLAGERLKPTHNTSLLMFAITWLVGRNPEASNLYSAYSDYITNAFYTGCLEIIGDKVTYRWSDIFPGKVVADTNAKEEYFNIDRKKRYASMTARSLYGTLNGATDCNGFLIADDLIGSIEEAMNKDRLVNVWLKVDNNLLPRAKQTAKILWCGTRWSLSDPIGLRRELVTTSKEFANHRVRIITLPALNENGESNFNYDYNVGFDTNYYKARMASFEHNNDLASWEAQYMQEPIERSGSLFEPGEMLYYNGELPPDDMLVRKFMAVDPAFGGGDYTAAPVVFQYTDGSCYIVDCVYSNEEKGRTQAMIVDAIQKYGVTAVRFECNKMTMSYKEEVEKALKAKGLKINLMTKAAPNNQAKEARIMDKAATIRGFYFLEDNKRSKTYQAFILNTFSFKIVGGNKHDDAPDSLAMAADFVERPATNRVEFMKRPW